MFSVLAVVALFAVACASAATDPAESDGIACDYHPFGDGSVQFEGLTAAELGSFDSFLRVRITGHSFSEQTAELENIATVTEVVSGNVAEGSVHGLRSGFGLCLEKGDDYYVLAVETGESGFLRVPHPWATFPVINNRITLHPDMRKDSLIGDTHGLDPVLFKRRFVELVDRADIEVD